ncbi:MAG: nucleoside-diphosphate sugar epimerase/dehydratase [Candidatus Zixiibacteriota bacterium]
MQQPEIKRISRRRREIIIFLADLVMIQLCFLIAVILFHNLREVRNSFGETLGYFYGWPNLVVTGYWLGLLYLSRLLKTFFPQGLYGEFLRIFNVVSLGVVVMIFLTVDSSDPASFFSNSKILIFAYWASLILALCLNRIVMYQTPEGGAAETPEGVISPLLLPRRLTIVMLDLIIIAAAYYCAYLIRFEGGIPSADLNILQQSLPVVIILRFSMLLYFRLYSGYYRYASISDLTQILKAITAGSILIAIPTYFFGYGNIPRGVFVIEWLLLVVLLGGSRFMLRAARELMPQMWRQGRRTFIVGAGSAGEMVLRELRKTPMGLKPVGIIDDDQQKHGMRLHGTTVVGGSDDLDRLALKYKVTDAIIAIPSATGPQMRALVDSCRRAHLSFKSLPPLREIIGGQVELSQVRNISVEDLLGRNPVRLDSVRLATFIQGKRILVTGGAGSIGSEICRQVMRFHPDRLTIIDRAENRLYEMLHEMRGQAGNEAIDPHVADINDAAKMDRIFELIKPEIVFHAAAYKQVPLMETFPEEATRNNIFGTKTLVELADKHEVAVVVMISTDKAVRPSSVMGASKRIAEILVQCFAKRSRTSFITVRFGNVLGSDGSVVPIFKRQIEHGGPVTVTHPEMTRYFMTIAEASLLVMQAATIGKSGDILVLNMGEPVRIVDLARSMITLSGRVPDEEILIEFTGLRPGEKLTEELFDEEGLQSSEHENILVARATDYEWEAIKAELAKLDRAAREQDREQIIQLFREIVPGYQSVPKQINQ